MANITCVDSNWIVSDIVKRFPRTMPVFVNWKLDCLGCTMATFCTLEDVAKDYHLNLALLIEDLRQAANDTPSLGKDPGDETSL